MKEQNTELFLVDPIWTEQVQGGRVFTGISNMLLSMFVPWRQRSCWLQHIVSPILNFHPSVVGCILFVDNTSYGAQFEPL